MSSRLLPQRVGSKHFSTIVGTGSRGTHEAELNTHLSVQVEFVCFRTKSGSDLPSLTVLLWKKQRARKPRWSYRHWPVRAEHLVPDT